MSNNGFPAGYEWPIPLEGLRPRVALIVAKLYHFQDIIDHFENGHIQIHFGGQAGVRLKIDGTLQEATKVSS